MDIQHCDHEKGTEVFVVQNKNGLQMHVIAMRMQISGGSHLVKVRDGSVRSGKE